MEKLSEGEGKKGYWIFTGTGAFEDNCSFLKEMIATMCDKKYIYRDWLPEVDANSCKTIFIGKTSQVNKSKRHFYNNKKNFQKIYRLSFH